MIVSHKGESNGQDKFENHMETGGCIGLGVDHIFEVQGSDGAAYGLRVLGCYAVFFVLGYPGIMNRVM